MENSLGNKEIMAKNIRYYMDLNNLSRQDVCKAIGVKYTTFTDWVNGNVYPRIDKIELMANYFGVTKSDLVEAHDQKKLPFTPDEIEIIYKLRELDQDSMSFIISALDNEYKRAKRLEEFAKKYQEMKDQINREG